MTSSNNKCLCRDIKSTLRALASCLSLLLQLLSPSNFVLAQTGVVSSLVITLLVDVLYYQIYYVMSPWHDDLVLCSWSICFAVRINGAAYPIGSYFTDLTQDISAGWFWVCICDTKSHCVNLSIPKNSKCSLIWKTAMDIKVFHLFCSVFSWYSRYHISLYPFTHFVKLNPPFANSSRRSRITSLFSVLATDLTKSSTFCRMAFRVSRSLQSVAHFLRA